MTQPKALRLAGELAAEIKRTVAVDMLHHNAAAELRRLHQFAEDQIGRATAAEAALQMTKATHALKIAAVEAQRDALLEKIKAVIAAEQSEGAGRGGFINTPPTREHQRRVAQAWQELHAAIKQAEGEKE